MTSTSIPDLTLKRSIWLILLLWGLFLSGGYGQTVSLSGSNVNRYAEVTQIYCYEGNDADTLELVSAAGFGEGDTVMLYCVQGAR